MPDRRRQNKRRRRTKVYELSDEGLTLVGYRYTDDEPLQEREPQPAEVAEALREAEVLHASGKHEQAAELARRLVEHAPHCAPLFSLLGRIALARGRLLEAERYLRRAVELDPTNERYGREMAEALARRREAGEAAAARLARPAPPLAGLDQPQERPLASLAGSPARAAGFAFSLVAGLAAFVAAGTVPFEAWRAGQVNLGVLACAVGGAALWAAALELGGVVRSFQAEMTGDVADSFARQLGLHMALVVLVACAVNIFAGALALVVAGVVAECWPRSIWSFVALSFVGVGVALARGTEPALWVFLWLGNLCFVAAVAVWAALGVARRTHWE